MNNRIIQAQGLVTNGVAIGGMSAIGFDAKYVDIIESEPDGAAGSEEVDRAGLSVPVRMACTDVMQAAAILDAAVGVTTFSGKESGQATWHDYTVDNIVWNSMTIAFQKAADAVLSVNGVLRFADGSKELEDVVRVAADAAMAPALTFPTRLYRPSGASFDPDGADPAIAPLHTRSVQLSLDAPIEAAYGDSDIGHTAVDRKPWKPLRVKLEHSDARVNAGKPSHVSAEILKGAGRGVLTVALQGRAGAANKVLNVKNLLWTEAPEGHSATYSEFAVSGSAGWRTGGGTPVLHTLNGANPLFSFV